MPTEPTDPVSVIEDFSRDVEGGLLGMSGGRFYAWAIGGSLPAALAAVWLTSAWDQNAALYACSPAAAIVEEVVGVWLKQLLGIPESASFALVTGCQMAHVTCLAAARHALLARAGWSVEERRLSGAPSIRIVCSSSRHASVEHEVRLLGFGTQNVAYIEPGDDETMDPAALRATLRSESNRPTVVLLQAGDINTGSFDAFERLIPIAHECDAWVHIDGALGLFAGASPSHRHLIRGVEGADSWAPDGHKWLNVPFDCGCAFVADAAAHRASMSTRAPYIATNAEARDEIDWNPEWSRRARGFSTYAAQRELGREGLAEMIDRTCRHARSIVKGIGNLAGVQVLWTPIINQGLLRFLSDANPRTNAQHDVRTDRVIAQVVRSGEAFFGPTTWRGMRAMRVSVLNWRTSNVEVSRAIRAVADALETDHFSNC
jgi:glutamate/tyrosine decarboxylase-like PLP-dependent enzyme